MANRPAADASIPRKGSTPAATRSFHATYAPTTTNAPWATLMTFMTPQTSEKPTATRANRPPWSRPLTVAWANSVTASLVLARGRPDQICFGRVLRPDRHHLSVLDLDDRHRLGHVLASVV